MGVLSSAAVTVRGRPPVSHRLHADAGQAGIQLRLLREGAGRQQGATANMGRGSPQGVLLPAGAEQQTAARLEQ